MIFSFCVICLLIYYTKIPINTKKKKKTKYYCCAINHEDKNMVAAMKMDSGDDHGDHKSITIEVAKHAG
jgi:hypothetical protein